MRISTMLLAVAAMSLAVSGCMKPEQKDDMGGMEHSAKHEGMGMKHDGMKMQMACMQLMKVDKAVAVIYPTQGNSASGSITFEETPEGLHISGEITGLAPNTTHAMHIHEFGDQTSADGSSAGGHFNPEGHDHGAPGSAHHHAGDLGNIVADASGVAKVDLTVPDISIGGQEGKDPVIGRGVVIHAKADDFSQPVGNAGGRIGVGVIGVAKVAKPAATMPAMPGM